MEEGIAAAEAPLAEEDTSAAPECRICRGEGSAEAPLHYPCKCSGSMRWVHADCLAQWLALSKARRCEARAARAARACGARV